MEIQITGLSRVTSPKPNRYGDIILAYFDVHVDWLSIQGAAFVKLASGGLTTWEPLGKDDRLPQRSMKMCGAVRREVAQAALPLFEAMGGKV
ncbi:MAG: hypothetical protein K8F59_02560 [Rhodobacteraceae bacterium]|nr:hypothetical protein [Paracoccaceae bacterium]